MGSDIVYCFHLFRDKLVKYNPDVVFLLLKLYRYYRFSLAGVEWKGLLRMVKFNIECKPHGGEPIYQYSFVLRAWVRKVLKYDFFFHSTTAGGEQ